MTRDQAARILHPDTREIAFVECINSDTRKWREDLEEAARMGAEALMLWIRTEVRKPTKEDADSFDDLIVKGISGRIRVVPRDMVFLSPGSFPYWMPIPPLPEVTE